MKDCKAEAPGGGVGDPATELSHVGRLIEDGEQVEPRILLDVPHKRFGVAHLAIEALLALQPKNAIVRPDDLCHPRRATGRRIARLTDAFVAACAAADAARC
jgi:hypothetical protein